MTEHDLALLAHRAAAAVAERVGGCEYVVSPADTFRQLYVGFEPDKTDRAIRALVAGVVHAGYRRFSALGTPSDRSTACGFANERGVWVRAIAQYRLYPTEGTDMRLDVLGAP